MAAKRPTNTIRLVTKSLTKRQLRALTVFISYDLTMPRLAVNAGVLPPSGQRDLQEAMRIVHGACVARCKRHEVNASIYS